MQILDWALHNKNDLGLEVIRFKWISAWLPNHFDFQASIKLNGKIYTGRGIHSDEETAISKAIGEAVERSILRYIPGISTSSGVAVHASTELARRGATLELIERDRFMCHYLTGCPPSPVGPAVFEETELPFQAIIENLAQLGVKLWFAEMRKCPAVSSIICCASGVKSRYPFGLVVGLGCDETKHYALEHAFLETMKNVAVYLGEQASWLDWHLFEQEQKIGPEEHAALSLNPIYTEFFSQKFTPSDLTMVSNEDALETISLEEIELPEVVKDAPVVACRAYSPCLQNFYFGTTKPGVVNLPRLSEFAGRDLKFEDLETFPHCLG